MLHSSVLALDQEHIVVDGVDEIASDKEKITLLSGWEKLPTWTLIFSRPLDLHRDFLRSASSLSIEARNQDIENFVVSSLLNHASFKRTISGAQDALVREVAATVRKRCQGM